MAASSSASSNPVSHVDGAVRRDSIERDALDAKPQRPIRPTLTATQARLAEPDLAHRHGEVLDDLVLTFAARARHPFSVRLDDGGARDEQRPFGSAPRLEAEQTLARALQLLEVALTFAALASPSGALGHTSASAYQLAGTAKGRARVSAH